MLMSWHIWSVVWIASADALCPRQGGQQCHRAACSSAPEAACTQPLMQRRQTQPAKHAVCIFPYRGRRGTPRQPHLVPDARAALHLASGVPAACLRGLEGFSHCWVLYVFHENTGGWCLPAAPAACLGLIDLGHAPACVGCTQPSAPAWEPATTAVLPQASIQHALAPSSYHE